MPLRTRSLIGVATAGLLATGLAGAGLLQRAKAQSSAGTPGLEFRWSNNKDFKKLYYFVSNTERNRWANYFLILKGKDRKAAIMKLDVTVPDYFNTDIDPKNVRLSYCNIGGALKRTRCKETIPAEVKVTDEGNTIEIFPESPVPPDRAIGVVMYVSNPFNSGMYQFNALAQAPGDVPMAGYLGSWVVELTD